MLGDWVYHSKRCGSLFNLFARVCVVNNYLKQRLFLANVE